MSTGVVGERCSVRLGHQPSCTGSMYCRGIRLPRVFVVFIRAKAARAEGGLPTCLARLKARVFLSVILGYTSNPGELSLPIEVVLRLACSVEPRPFRASTLFARRSSASSCALDRGADGGRRSRGALWASHPCVFVCLWRRGGRCGCFCSRAMRGEDGQALQY